MKIGIGMTTVHSLSLVMVCILSVCACGMEGGIDPNRPLDQDYNPVISADDFPSSTVIDNIYFPYDDERTYVFRGESDEGIVRIEIQRLLNEITILGIRCIAIEEREYLGDRLTEVSRNWLAQDKHGNVWYFGEEVDNYNTTGDLINHHGSWKAGDDGAKAGMIMLDSPVPGRSYRQEYYFNSAEDEAEVTAVNVTVTVPLGTYDGCLKVREWTDLEPGVTEYKYYAPGIGLLKEENVNDNEVVMLIAING